MNRDDSPRQPKSPGEAAGQMIRLVTGYWTSQAIYVAAKLDIAERLADGPRSIDELAEATETHPRSLYRVLRALASIGIFTEQSDGRIAQTALSDCLRRDAPASIRSSAIMMGEEHFVAWGHLLDGVRTGQTVFDQVYGMPVFPYFEAHPEASEIFNQAMVELTNQTHVAVADAYDFSEIDTIVDVGAGHGALLRAILKAHPHLRAILFDQPAVVTGAAERLQKWDLADRCRTVGGDFFESVPAGGDAYILSTVIHDWDDQRSIRILKNIRAVMPPQGKLLLVEQVLKGPNEPDFGKFMDLNMLVMPGGMERTADEFERLLDASGFEMTRVLKTKSSSSIVEGVPQ